MPRGGKREGAGRKPKAATAEPATAPAPAPPQHVVELAGRMVAAGLTRERVVQELMSIGLTKITDVVAWVTRETGVDVDEDADTMTVRMSRELSLVDSARLDAATAAAIAEVTQTKDGALKVKMHPKQPALVALLKVLEPAKPAAQPNDASADALASAKKDDPWAGLLPN